MSRSTTLERTRLVISGVRSELVLEDGRVTITKETPTQAAPSSVTVGVDRIRGTSLNIPSRGGRGWIHVAVAGGSPAPPGELAAASDPYTVPITSRATGTAKRFSRLVEKHVAERGMPRDPRVAGRRYSSGVSLVDPPDGDRDDRGDAGPGASGPDVDAIGADEGAVGADAGDGEVVGAELVTQLRQLAELHEAGALTDEEFDRAKARLLR